MGSRNSRNTELLLSFYGDDFTGSTDAMEALTRGGVKTALFLEPPTQERLDQFPNLRAYGVAGISRSLGAEALEQQLRPVLERMRDIPTTIVHYKICSTFDSSPAIGSIGRAVDTAGAVFGEQGCVPLLVGVPQLRRYTLFGHHYAAFGDEIYRLDRHPTMMRHPVTPMDESDLRLLLSRQTDRTIGLMDILDLTGDGSLVRERLAARMADRPDMLLYDVMDEERLNRAGELIWEGAANAGNRFVVGSSGVEYALVAHWREAGITSPDEAIPRPAGKVDRVLAVSGSCSPVTEAQIRHAIAYGFADVPVDAAKLLDPVEANEERRRLIACATEWLRQGRSPLLYSAMGVGDAAIAATRQQLKRAGASPTDTGKLIGEQLGRLTREVVSIGGVDRFVVAGGDTSGYVMRELGIYALECAAPIAPGGPLCRGYSEDARFDGIELALKGGQVGKEDYFVRVLHGGGNGT
ncbi:four-carbon acid sugar kinase family protein [Cohnella sp. GCM10027633]|uniref:four-carbon acid sugar kinase family protein n=1 Tax=unclassified Cohnella TaxID=2636738 RepID=UPI00362788A6